VALVLAVGYDSTVRPLVGRISLGSGMFFKLLLMSIAFVPVLLGMRAATFRNPRRGFFVLVGLVLAYGTLYILLLYYLRLRWVG
jgi:hypothetical protein